MTESRFEALTLKAPYPSCHENSIAWPINYDEFAFNRSTASVPANRQDTDVMLLRNSSEVGPQARLQLLCDYFAAVLGSKNHVHVNVGEGVRQCIAPCATQHVNMLGD